MIGISVHPSIRFALYSLFVCGVIGTTHCSSDLTDSLEGRACDENGECLAGYKCDEDKNICVANEDSDSENGDVGMDGGLGNDAGDDATRGFDGNIDTGTDDGRDGTVDRGAESGFDSSVDAVVDKNVDANAESHIPNSDAGDTGSQADVGADARPCGYEIKPPRAECPIECDSCSNGVCFINCDLERECSDTKITCPSGFSCEVSCSNKQACENTRIDCPSIYNCTISCTAEQSCKSTWVRCGDDGPCALDCKSGTRACQDAELQCKNQACKASCGSEQIPPLIKNCSISCTSRCGC